MIKKTLWAAIPFLVFLGLFLLNMLRFRSGEHGAKLYTTHCQSCHLDGQGLRGLMPPLANADYLKNNQDSLACIIKNGMNKEITVNGKKYKGEMKGFPKLKDTEITNIINYINTQWGNEIPKRTLQQIRIDINNCNY